MKDKLAIHIRFFSATLPTMHATSTLSHKRRFLFGGFTAEYELTAPAEILRLSIAVDQSLQLLSWLQVPDAAHVEDIKGLAALDQIRSRKPGMLEEGEDELLYFTAEVPEPGGEKEEALSSRPRSKVSLSLRTRFEGYKGKSHILHSLKEKRSGSQLNGLATKELGQAIPIYPRELRVGLDCFKPSFMPWFGNSAVSYASILIECNRDSFLCRLYISETNNLMAPLKNPELLNRLGKLTETVCGLNLAADYLEKVSQ